MENKELYTKLENLEAMIYEIKKNQTLKIKHYDLQSKRTRIRKKR